MKKKKLRGKKMKKKRSYCISSKASEGLQDKRGTSILVLGAIFETMVYKINNNK